MTVVDLNADVGEWDSHRPESEADLMALITSANVACGGHAGNKAAMLATVELAAACGVAVGAHPGLEDRTHFGRRETDISPEAAFELVGRQVAALTEVANGRSVRVRHVKPHGALYNMAARDRGLADAIARALAGQDPNLALFGLSGSELIAAGTRAGLRTVSEVFADRAYLANGSLAPRSMTGAVLQDPDAVAERAVEMVLQQSVRTLDGSRLPLVAETICIHGDTPGAAVLARRVRDALQHAGIEVRAAS